MNLRVQAAYSLLLVAVFGAAGAQTAPAPAAATASPQPSANQLQPALQSLKRTFASLDAEHWKLTRQLHEETHRNIDSVRRDVDETLPGLIASSDADPGSVPAGFALLRNIDALYDVALRVAATAAVAAPAPQNAALEQTLAGLLQTRGALADGIGKAAAAQQTRVGELQAELRSRPAAASPACPTPAPVPSADKSKARRSKPRPKPVPTVPGPSTNP